MDLAGYAPSGGEADKVGAGQSLDRSADFVLADAVSIPLVDDFIGGFEAVLEHTGCEAGGE